MPKNKRNKSKKPISISAKEDPAVAVEIQRQLNAIDWNEFNNAVQRRTAEKMMPKPGVRRLYYQPPIRAIAA